MSGRLARPVGLVVACLALLGAGPAAAECRVGGRITADGLPLAGVEVIDKRYGASPRQLAQTGADGRFSASVEPLAATLHVLTVVLRKPPFREASLLFDKDRATGCPTPANRDAGLEHPTASGQPEAVPATCSQPSVAGLTIYLAPYEIYGAPDGGLASSLNGDLPQILHHRILAFQSRLGGVRREDISVEPICLALSAASGEEIRRVGAALNALAVIAGDGELRAVASGEPVVDLESVFRVVPTWRDFGGTPLQIGDTIPAGRLRPSRVAERLTDLWGKQAVLAVALRRLGEPHTPQVEDQVRVMLIELRKTMTPADPLLPDVQTLLERLEDGGVP